MFEPSEFDFVLLSEFQLSGGVSVYEYANHPKVDGKPDFLRINAYLSLDGDFVTVWRGLLDPAIAESQLGFVAPPGDLDLYASYTEDLFRGWIDTAEAGRYILAALHLDDVPPQALSRADGELRCDTIG